jgi:uncharacterized membrane protein YsdA (DUF1294 family)
MFAKFIPLNILISVVVFLFIFYSRNDALEGESEIILANIVFGIVQLVINSVYLRIKKSNMIFKVQFTIITLQIIELIIVLIYGLQINQISETSY